MRTIELTFCFVGFQFYTALQKNILNRFLVRGDVNGFLVFIDNTARFGAVWFMHMTF